MRALSLIQPWATLIAIGVKAGGKGVESRSWPMSYRGPIAIHASKTWPRWAKDICTEDPFFRTLIDAGYGNEHRQIKESAFPLGAIIAIANIVQCKYTGDDIYHSWVRELTDRERAFGDYSLKRYGLFVANVRALPEPIFCKGALGLWTVPADIAARLEELEGERTCKEAQ